MLPSFDPAMRFEVERSGSRKGARMEFSDTLHINPRIGHIRFLRFLSFADVWEYFAARLQSCTF